MIIVFVVYPRSTQAHLNARTPTWLNQKRYTTMLKSIAKDDYLCCISQEHSGTFEWLNQKGYVNEKINK